jgi:hypothetical protein
MEYAHAVMPQMGEFHTNPYDLFHAISCAIYTRFLWSKLKEPILFVACEQLANYTVQELCHDYKIFNKKTYVEMESSMSLISE